MKKIILYCVFLGTAAFLPLSQDKISAKKQTEFTLSQNQFAFRLFKALLDEDSSSANKLISPLSLYLSTALLYNGAAHETRDSIEEALQASGIGMANLNGFCKTLMLQLPLEDAHVRLSVSNSLWYNRKRCSLLPAFENIAGQFYYSAVQPANFNDRVTARQINNWVDANTNHLIPSIIRQTKPSEGIYLLNTIYFKGAWKQPFEGATYSDTFYVENSIPKKGPFMQKEFITKTFSDTSFTMIELPYGNGSTYNMYLILPEDESSSARNFAINFDTEKLQYALSRMTDQSLSLSLPRWQTTYSIGDWKPIFSRLGMGKVFNDTEGGDFSNMVKAPIRKPVVAKVLHTARISVNEKGTEMAAVNQVVNIPPPLSRGRRLHPIKVDHPFLYLLMDCQQQVILFTGIVNDPDNRGVDPLPTKSTVTRIKRSRQRRK